MAGPQNPAGALPSTSGIADPQVRAWADAMVSAWNLRSGHTGVGEKPNRFVTRAEIEGLAEDALYKTLSGAVSASPIKGSSQVKSAAQINKIIDNLADSIKKSLLYQILGTEIAPIVNRAVANVAAAGITNDATIRALRDLALAKAINTIWAAIGGTDAVIEDGVLSAATPSTAEATKWATVVAAVTDPNTGEVNSASIKEELTSYANSADDVFNAIYSVRAQLDVDGNTIVGGFGLAATSGAGSGAGPTIDFGVRADRFYIAATSSTPDAATQLDPAYNSIPFMVLTSPEMVNGKLYPPGVYMKRVVIGEATIGTAEIEDLSVETLKIAGNAVTQMVAATAYGWGVVSVTVTVTSAFLPPGSSTVPVVVTGSTDVLSSTDFDIGVDIADFTVQSPDFYALPPGGGTWSFTQIFNVGVGVHVFSCYNHGAGDAADVANTRQRTITAVVGKR